MTLPVTILSCADDAPVVSLSDNPQQFSCPEPSVRVRGVAGVGASSFKVSDSILPAAAHGIAGPRGEDGTTAWTLTFWAWIWDGPTGEFRTLFHKGDGGDNRTPAAWLLPNDMRLALRVSSATQANLGTESLTQLPIRQWVHLAFMFRNSTNSSSFQLEYYVNGELDCSLQFNEPVLANGGPLRLGRDTWERGTRMLVSDVKVFAQRLQHSSIVLDYRAGLQMHAQKFQKSALDAGQPGMDAQLRLYDAVFRATEIVSRWVAPPLPPTEAAKTAYTHAQTLLDSCDVDYVTAMEVGHARS